MKKNKKKALPVKGRLMDRLYLLINSRTHIGCDIIDELTRITSTGFQFTHSRGVRQEYCLQMLLRDHFNSRTHAGCDLMRHLLQDMLIDFDSRAHTEGATPQAVFWAGISSFDSRTHIERDVWAMQKLH